MNFVIRNKDFLFTETPQEGDEILKHWNNVPDSKPFQKYITEMRELCGNPAGCKFPQSYFGNIRPWDYEQMFKHGEFKDTDLVLECGSLHSYFCVWQSQYVKHYTTGDSFYWASREYAKNQNLQSPQEWCNYVMSKGKGKLFAEEADLQNLKYPDESFDKVFNISVIEHVHNDRKGVEEMMRVLKPGGTLLLTTEYNKTHNKLYSETDDSYYRIYDEKDIEKLFNGFNIEVIDVEGIDPPPGKFTTLFLRIRK